MNPASPEVLAQRLENLERTLAKFEFSPTLALTLSNADIKSTELLAYYIVNDSTRVAELLSTSLDNYHFISMRNKLQLMGELMRAGVDVSYPGHDGDFAVEFSPVGRLRSQLYDTLHSKLCSQSQELQVAVWNLWCSGSALRESCRRANLPLSIAGVMESDPDIMISTVAELDCSMVHKIYGKISMNDRAKEILMKLYREQSAEYAQITNLEAERRNKQAMALQTVAQEIASLKREASSSPTAIDVDKLKRKLSEMSTRFSVDMGWANASSNSSPSPSPSPSPTSVTWGANITDVLSVMPELLRMETEVRELEKCLALSADASAISDEVFIASIDAGEIMRAVPLGLPARCMTEPAPFKLLRPPDLCRLHSATMPIYSERFESASTKAAYTQTLALHSAGKELAGAVRASGWVLPISADASGSNTEQANQEVSRTLQRQEASVREHTFVPMQSCTLTSSNIALDDHAVREARAVRTVEDAQAFLLKFYSHVAIGTVTFGGIFSKLVNVTSTETITLDSLHAKASDVLNGNAIVGGAASPLTAEGTARHESHSGKETTSVVKEADARCTVETKIMVHGPDASTPETFKLALHASRQDWKVIDRGHMSTLIPVWVILGRHADPQVKDAAPLVRDAWLEFAKEWSKVEPVHSAYKLHRVVNCSTAETDEELNQALTALQRSLISQLESDEAVAEVARGVRNAFGCIDAWSVERSGDILPTFLEKRKPLAELLLYTANNHENAVHLHPLARAFAESIRCEERTDLAQNPLTDYLFESESLSRMFEACNSGSAEPRSPRGSGIYSLEELQEAFACNMYGAPLVGQQLGARVGAVLYREYSQSPFELEPPPSSTEGLRTELLRGLGLSGQGFQDENVTPRQAALAGQMISTHTARRKGSLTIRSRSTTVAEEDQESSQCDDGPSEPPSVLALHYPRGSSLHTTSADTDQVINYRSALCRSLRHRLLLPKLAPGSMVYEFVRTILPHETANCITRPYDILRHMLLTSDVIGAEEILSALLARQCAVPLVLSNPHSVSISSPMRTSTIPLSLTCTKTVDGVYRPFPSADPDVMRVAVVSLALSVEGSYSPQVLKQVFQCDSFLSGQGSTCASAFEVGYGQLSTESGNCPVELYHVVGCYEEFRHTVLASANVLIVEGPRDSNFPRRTESTHAVSLLLWRPSGQNGVAQAIQGDVTDGNFVDCRIDGPPQSSCECIRGYVLRARYRWLEDRHRNLRPLPRTHPPEAAQLTATDSGEHLSGTEQLVTMQIAADAAPRLEISQGDLCLQALFCKELAAERAANYCALSIADDYEKRDEAAVARSELTRLAFAACDKKHPVIDNLLEILAVIDPFQRFIKFLHFLQALRGSFLSQQPRRFRSGCDARDDEAEVHVQQLWAQLACIYAALCSAPHSPHRNGKQTFAHLPDLAAVHLADGFPLELLDGHYCELNIVWFQAVVSSLERLHQQRHDAVPVIFVVSVLGLSDAGKTTLLDTMFGCRTRSYSSHTTRGITMRVLRCGFGPYDYVVVLDTESLGPPPVDEPSKMSRRNRLALTSMWAADAVIVVPSASEMSSTVSVVRFAAHMLDKTTLLQDADCRSLSQLFVAVRNSTSESLATWAKELSTIDGKLRQNFDLQRDIIPLCDVAPLGRYGEQVLKLRDRIHERTNRIQNFRARTFSEWANCIELIGKEMTGLVREMEAESVEDEQSRSEFEVMAARALQDISKAYTQACDDLEQNFASEYATLRAGDALPTPAIPAIPAIPAVATSGIHQPIPGITSPPSEAYQRVTAVMQHLICTRCESEVMRNLTAALAENSTGRLPDQSHQRVARELKRLQREANLRIEQLVYFKAFRQEKYTVYYDMFEKLSYRRIAFRKQQNTWDEDAQLQVFEEVFKQVYEKSKDDAPQTMEATVEACVNAAYFNLCPEVKRPTSSFPLFRTLCVSFFPSTVPNVVSPPASIPPDLLAAIQAQTDNSLRVSDAAVRECIRVTKEMLSAKNILDSATIASVHRAVQHEVVTAFRAKEHRWYKQNSVAAKLKEAKPRMLLLFEDRVAGRSAVDSVIGHLKLAFSEVMLRESFAHYVATTVLKRIRKQEIDLQRPGFVTSAKVLQAHVDLDLLSSIDRPAELRAKLENPTAHYDSVFRRLLTKQLRSEFCDNTCWRLMRRQICGALVSAAVTCSKPSTKSERAKLFYEHLHRKLKTFGLSKNLFAPDNAAKDFKALDAESPQSIMGIADAVIAALPSVSVADMPIPRHPLCVSMSAAERDDSKPNGNDSCPGLNAEAPVAVAPDRATFYTSFWKYMSGSSMSAGNAAGNADGSSLSAGSAAGNADGSSLSAGSAAGNADGSSLSAGNATGNADGSSLSAGNAAGNAAGNVDGSSLSAGNAAGNADGSGVSAGNAAEDAGGNNSARAAKRARDAVSGERLIVDKMIEQLNDGTADTAFRRRCTSLCHYCSIQCSHPAGFQHLGPCMSPHQPMGLNGAYVVGAPSLLCTDSCTEAFKKGHRFYQKDKLIGRFNAYNKSYPSWTAPEPTPSSRLIAREYIYNHCQSLLGDMFPDVEIRTPPSDFNHSLNNVTSELKDIIANTRS